MAGCDADLVALGERCSSAHLRRLVSLTRPVPASGDDDDHRRRELSAWWDEDRAVLDIRGRLCGDAAMTAYTALVRAADAMPPDPATGAHEPLGPAWPTPSSGCARPAWPTAPPPIARRWWSTATWRCSQAATGWPR